MTKQITIANKKLDINFGIKSLEILDKYYPKVKTEDGLELGVGIPKSILDYTTGDLTALAKWIEAGTATNKKPVTYDEAITLLDKVEDMDELEAIGKELFDFFTSAQAVMYRMNAQGMLNELKDMRKGILEA